MLRIKDKIPQPTHKALHNLCKENIQPPTGAADVLGLGLNFCVESPCPHQGQNFTNSLRRLHYSIRLFVYYGKFNTITTTNDDEYEPSLYVKKDDWTPEEKNITIEHKFTLFRNALLAKYHNLSISKQYNLTSHNRYCIKELVHQTDLIKGFTNKNLGPFIMPRPDYIQQMLHGHLLNTDYYQLLSEANINSRISTQTDDLLKLLADHRENFPKLHQDYFDQSIKLLDKTHKHIPQIYGCPKLHKHDYIDKPLNRPILICVATLPQVYFTYIDYWMKKIVQTLLPSYVENADTLIDKLKKHFTRKLPPGARIFSIDAISMYSNIDSVHGLQVINNFFEYFKDKLPKHFPQNSSNNH